jgi:predicted ATPase
VSSLKTGTLAEPVLVGRVKELEELQRCLDSAIKGRGATVFISGEAGAGKTRLVSEFLKKVKKSDVTVLAGWCLSNAAVPYFPFFEAFNAYFTGELTEKAEFATDIAGWLKGPSQAEKPQGISPQVWKDQTFAAVAKTLASISAKKPVILFIDDVHWADSASLSLVHYLARTINSERVLLLVSFRSEQLASDVEG